MNTIDRAKNMIASPNKEWDVIALEQPNTGKIITNYVLYLEVRGCWPPLLAMVLLDLTTVSSAYSSMNGVYIML